MRKIEFRAWDKKNKHMLLDVHKSDIFYDMTVLPDSYNVMQNTGLKDRNDIEIYEGDLLNTPGAPSEVRWHNDGWDVYCHWLDEPDWHDDIVGLAEDCDQLGLEVIGNIFENPELIGENDGKRVKA